MGRRGAKVKERMTMPQFWFALAELRHKGWVCKVDNQRVLRLHQKLKRGGLGLCYELIPAVAFDKGHSVGPFDWKLAAEKLGLSKTYTTRIIGASREISPLVSHLKRTRAKMLRSLGLNLNDYLDSGKLE